MKKIAGLLIATALAFTLSTASATTDACAASGCWSPPPYPGCVCMGHDLYICP